MSKMEERGLRIIVFMKVIHQLTSERGFDAAKRTLDPEYLVRMINPADEHALEMALLVKERIEKRRGLAEIFVLSVVPDDDEWILRHSLAMGADQAFRVWGEGFESLSAGAVAYLLSMAVKRIGGDLILCGKRSLDTNENEGGGYLAEFLHLPHVSEVTSTDFSKEGDKLVCRRRMDRLGWDLVETPLPVILSVERGENEPRYPNLYSILDWLEKKIEVFDMISLGVDVNRLGDLKLAVQATELTRPRPKKMFTPKSDLPPEERIRLAMTGGMEKKKATFLQGDAKKIADQVIDLLFKQKFLKKD
jgi:electron transfer flavoprotein beta subunit